MENFISKKEIELENNIDKIRELSKHNERIKIINALLDRKMNICTKKFISMEEKAQVDFIDTFIKEDLGGIQCYLD